MQHDGWRLKTIGKRCVRVRVQRLRQVSRGRKCSVPRPRACWLYTSSADATYGKNTQVICEGKGEGHHGHMTQVQLTPTRLLDQKSTMTPPSTPPKTACTCVGRPPQCVSFLFPFLFPFE